MRARRVLPVRDVLRRVVFFLAATIRLLPAGPGGAGRSKPVREHPCKPSAGGSGFRSRAETSGGRAAGKGFLASCPR